MASALTLHRTTTGKKALVAITGLILFGFVIGHLAGNLLVFAGYEAYNGYAHALKSNLPLLWGTRITVLGAVVVHIAMTMSLAGRNSGARGSRYKKKKDQVTSYAARTMVMSGPILGAYLLFHIAHFTAPGLSIGGEFDAINAYGNLVRGFREPWVAGTYIFCNAMLGLHLFHGAWSAFQSVGAGHPKYNPLRKTAAAVLATLICAGNVFIPVAVLTGITGSDEQLQLSDQHPLGPDVAVEAEAE